MSCVKWTCLLHLCLRWCIYVGFSFVFVCVDSWNSLRHCCFSLCHSLHARRYRFVNRWRVLLGSIYNKPVNANVVEVKTIVYHSSYLPFVDANIDDNSRDIAVLALTQPLTFNGRRQKGIHTYSSNKKKTHLHTTKHWLHDDNDKGWGIMAKECRETQRGSHYGN